MRVDGKVAIVTGAGGGIGGAIAERLVAEGARVVVADLDADAVARTVDRIAATSPDAVRSAAGDVSDDAVIAELIAVAEQEFGPVDLYFANAGISGGVGLDVSDDVWDKSLSVNVLGHVRAARRLIPGWVERGEGYFVSTASAAGLLTQIGSATYSVTKHAAVAFSEWLSVTYGDSGVRVSCLCPMGVDTPLLYEGQNSGDPLGAASTRAVLGSGDVLQPSDVAESVIAAMAAEQFLILPHPRVLDMFRHKGADYDRWLAGMRRYQQSIIG